MIDPNIALQVRPLQVESPLARFAQVGQIQGMQQQNRLAEMQLAQQEMAQAEDRATREAYQQAGGDTNVLLQNLQKAGLYKPAQTVQKQLLDNRKTEAEIKRAEAGTAKDTAAAKLTEIDGKLRNFDIIGRLFNGVQDQAGYDAARAAAAQYLPPEMVQGMNPVFDPQRIQQARMQALTVKDQLEQQWKKLAHDLAVEQFDQTKVRDAANIKNQEGMLGVARKNADTNAGQLGVSRARLEHEKATAGQGVTYQQTADGIVALPTKAVPGQAVAGRPVLGADGQPLRPQMDAGQRKEVQGLDAQIASVASAIREVSSNPSAFSLARGLPGKAGPVAESLASRTDSPSESSARSMVFNVVSKVINERAGAAQSAQELQRLQSFLPGETDNAEQIQNKLKGFQKYLADQRDVYASPAGMPPKPAAEPAKPAPKAPAPPKLGETVDGYTFKGGNPADPKSWAKVGG